MRTRAKARARLTSGDSQFTPASPLCDVVLVLGDAGRPDLLVAADYDPGLRYLCLTAFDAGPRTSD